MQIAFSYPSGTRGGVQVAILGDDAIKHYIKGYRPRMTMNNQTVSIPRAEWEETIPRGLAKIPLTWETHRSFASNDENFSFMHAHMLQLKGKPSGIIAVTGLTTGIAYKAAVLEEMEVVDIAGCSSVVRYSFACSELAPVAV